MFDQIIVVTSDRDAIKEALITKNYPKDEELNKQVSKPLGYRYENNRIKQV